MGVFARSVEDAALLAEPLVGFDEEDPDTRPIARPPFASVAMSEPPLPPRFAFVHSPAWKHVEPVTQEAFGELVEALGDAAAEVEIGASFERAFDMHRVVMEVEMAHNLHRDYEKGGEQLSATLRQLIERGRAQLAVDYARALPALRRSRCARCDTWNTMPYHPAAPGEPGYQDDRQPIFCTMWTISARGNHAALAKSECGRARRAACRRRGNDARLLRTRALACHTTSRQEPASHSASHGRRCAAGTKGTSS